MNLWVAFSGMGGGLAVFFKDGPFAWNGLIGFWAPITIFAIWLCVTTYLLRAAVQREAAAEAETVTDDAVAMTRA
jgi:membrane protein implicated in regulation of membrane protease activity